jgi:hypothetical protein
MKERDIYREHSKKRIKIENAIISLKVLLVLGPKSIQDIVCCCCHWVYKFLLFSFPSSIDIWDGPAAAKKKGRKEEEGVCRWIL